MMDEELLKVIDQRAHALWEAAGSPDGHELVYRLRAEREIANSAAAPGEDLPCGDDTSGGAAGLAA